MVEHGSRDGYPVEEACKTRNGPGTQQVLRALAAFRIVGT